MLLQSAELSALLDEVLINPSELFDGALVDESKTPLARHAMGQATGGLASDATAEHIAAAERAAAAEHAAAVFAAIGGAPPSTGPGTGTGREAQKVDKRSTKDAEVWHPGGKVEGDRLPRPCTACRASRVLCDRGNPCRRCVRLGIECTIPKSVPKGRPTMRMLAERARLAEEGKVLTTEQKEAAGVAGTQGGSAESDEAGALQLMGGGPQSEGSASYRQACCGPSTSAGMGGDARGLGAHARSARTGASAAAERPEAGSRSHASEDDDALDDLMRAGSRRRHKERVRTWHNEEDQPHDAGADTRRDDRA